MPALIAVINRTERRVRLDPAFGLGDGVECRDGDEVRLLRTSEFGHLGEHAKVIAAALRRAGWKVNVRDCSSLRPRDTRVIGGRAGGQYLNSSQVAQAATVIAADLVNAIGEVQHERTKTKTRAYVAPQTPPLPVGDGPSMRFTTQPPGGCLYRCRVCGHATASNHVLGHVRNRGHNEWEPVHRLPDGTFAPAQAQARSPELTGSASSASDQRPNGDTHPERSAAFQRPPDGSAS